MRKSLAFIMRSINVNTNLFENMHSNSQDVNIMSYLLVTDYEKNIMCYQMCNSCVPRLHLYFMYVCVYLKYMYEWYLKYTS